MKPTRGSRRIDVDEGAKATEILATNLLGIVSGDIQPRLTTVMRISEGWRVSARGLFMDEE